MKNAKRTTRGNTFRISDVYPTCARILVAAPETQIHKCQGRTYDEFLEAEQDEDTEACWGWEYATHLVDVYRSLVDMTLEQDWENESDEEFFARAHKAYENVRSQYSQESDALQISLTFMMLGTNDQAEA